MPGILAALFKNSSVSLYWFSLNNLKNGSASPSPSPIKKASTQSAKGSGLIKTADPPARTKGCEASRSDLSNGIPKYFKMRAAFK